MTAQTEWLIDKSAIARLHTTPDQALWLERIARGLVCVATPTLLEIGYSARSGEDWTSAVTGLPVALMPLHHLTPGAERRALQVQGLLANRGQHRAASVTGQSTERIRLAEVA
ncbi:MAG: hypothetical protein LBO20_08745 [Bifidobacteriaceae bacterium]|jgi:predicted nucleic acid-binding protein|nr:hypothetical protein [Bifidobacteriaceae bacterium]